MIGKLRKILTITSDTAETTDVTKIVRYIKYIVLNTPDERGKKAVAYRICSALVPELTENQFQNLPNARTTRGNAGIFLQG